MSLYPRQETRLQERSFQKATVARRSQALGTEATPLKSYKETPHAAPAADSRGSRVFSALCTRKPPRPAARASPPPSGRCTHTHTPFQEPHPRPRWPGIRGGRAALRGLLPPHPTPSETQVLADPPRATNPAATRTLRGPAARRAAAEPPPPAPSQEAAAAPGSGQVGGGRR